jgi:hypothetical protein
MVNMWEPNTWKWRPATLTSCAFIRDAPPWDHIRVRKHSQLGGRKQKHVILSLSYTFFQDEAAKLIYS